MEGDQKNQLQIIHLSTNAPGQIDAERPIVVQTTFQTVPQQPPNTLRVVRIGQLKTAIDERVHIQLVTEKAIRTIQTDP